jgi:CRP/FNR family cyclic AMP-dependent transcriptional regulator
MSAAGRLRRRYADPRRGAVPQGTLEGAVGHTIGMSLEPQPVSSLLAGLSGSVRLVGSARNSPSGGPRLSEQAAAAPSPEAALAALPLLGGVSPEVRASFAEQGRLHRYRAGTVMFIQGDPPDAVYCILTGRVEITTTAADGRIRLLAMVTSGDLLGELAVLGGTARSGSAICVADTTAWAVDGQRFLRFLTDHPPVALALLSSLSRLVIAQNGLVDDMLFLDLRGRVAKRLLGLATKSRNAPPGDGTIVDWGLPQADLAYLCGGTRANVSRVLSEFGRRQLIQRSGRQYILRDVSSLRRLAGL